MLKTPPGLELLPGGAAPAEGSRIFHQLLVLSLTFLAYASFHASRKPPSIVKAVLTGPVNQTAAAYAAAESAPLSVSGSDSFRFANNGTGWAPFNGSDGPQLLGGLDLTFLSSYAAGMYFAGHLGDRFDLRIFLTAGMVGSGLFVILFGLGYFLEMHSFIFFVIIQGFCGLFQSVGWPCVVAAVGNWCGQAQRGLVMGLWNSHTSLGNIIGSVIASSMLGFGWGWSFVLPGLLIWIVAVLVYMFLVVHPQVIGFQNGAESNVEGAALVGSEQIEDDGNGGSVAIGFLDAWRLPNVASFAFCLFFSKLVSYTFLYWLPFYIQDTVIDGTDPSDKTAGILSTIFDIGCLFGGISAGYISDKIEARGVTAFVFLLLSIPTLLSYHFLGSISTVTNLPLMFASGLLVNGPYSLISTAVAADLGTQSTISGNAQALATVTAIIDGTGSMGAALGPLLAGLLYTRGWGYVFFMLVVSVSIAACLLICVVLKEIRVKLNQGRWLWLSIANQ